MTTPAISVKHSTQTVISVTGGDGVGDGMAAEGMRPPSAMSLGEVQSCRQIALSIFSLQPSGKLECSY